jgi:hypothetical protein
MNGNFDGGHGVYGSVLVGALAELSALLNKPGRERRKESQSWKGAMLVLTVVGTPVALLLAGILGS